MYVDKNPNAAILLASNHLALAVVVVTAILTSSDGFAQGLADSAVYGLFGVLLQVIALRLMNCCCRGNSSVWSGTRRCAVPHGRSVRASSPSAS